MSEEHIDNNNWPTLKDLIPKSVCFGDTEESIAKDWAIGWLKKQIEVMRSVQEDIGQPHDDILVSSSISKTWTCTDPWLTIHFKIAVAEIIQKELRSAVDRIKEQEDG